MKILDPELTTKIAKLTQQVPRVIKVEKCHTRKMGAMNHADIHIWVDQDISVAEGHRIAHEVKIHIQTQLPQFIDVMIHVEPT